jgi:hypothetical protein
MEDKYIIEKFDYFYKKLEEMKLDFRNFKESTNKFFDRQLDLNRFNNILNDIHDDLADTGGSGGNKLKSIES